MKSPFKLKSGKTYCGGCRKKCSGEVNFKSLGFLPTIIRIHALERKKYKQPIDKKEAEFSIKRCCEWEIAITTPPVSPALSVGSLFQKVGRLLMVVVMMIVVLVITVVVDVIIMMVVIVISVMC